MDKKILLILAVFLVLLCFFEFIYLKTKCNWLTPGPMETFKNYHNEQFYCSTPERCLAVSLKYSASIPESYKPKITRLQPNTARNMMKYLIGRAKLLIIPYSRMKIEDTAITEDWAKITYTDKKDPTSEAGQTILVKINGAWKIKSDIGLTIKDPERLKKIQKIYYPSGPHFY